MTDRIRRVLLLLEVFLVVGAIGGALVLLTGSADLGASEGDLPFGSPIVAGIALALVNGLLPGAVVVGTVQQKNWARRGHLVAGVALIAWITVQVGLLGFGSWLQLVFFLYGVAISALAVAYLRRTAGTPA